ncbi:MAG: hypothetical protein EOO93_20985 [Pedobacter sp.]|nr:MAG: hypothetical protein EOO93_20985 [Pedobacter sp.]
MLVRMDATGMRLFDVAFNDKVVLDDLDIWKLVGHDSLLKKIVKTTVKGGQLTISFPEIKAGQAVISAIAIASLDKSIKPAAQSKSIIKASDNAFTADWLDIGDKQYTDETVEFISLPSNLFGSEWITTSNKKKEKIQFSVNETADVFVMVDVAVKDKLEWLANFEDTKTLAENSLNTSFKVYRKRFNKGESVILGLNPSNVSTYSVAVVPPSELEPAYDLKTTTSYKATDAKLIGDGIVKEDLMGKQRVTFKSTSKDVLEWSLWVGVADTYSLTIKYHNPFDKIIKAKLEFLSADGTIMKTEMAEFAPTKAGKWNYLNTNTGTMINAGNYKLRILAVDTGGLSIDALDVQ